MKTVSEKTLNQIFDELGFRVCQTEYPGKKRVFDSEGKDIGLMSAEDAWDYLYKEGFASEDSRWPMLFGRAVPMLDEEGS